MTPIDVAQLSTSLLATLATSAVRTLLLGGAAGLGLAAFRVKSTSVRLFTWTAVLYAALALPIKTAVGLAAGSLSQRILKRPGAIKWLNRFSGTVLVALGLRLAATERG